MAISSAMPETHCHVRSISMPTRPHPNYLNIEEVLRKLRTSESSNTLKADAVNVHLTGLAELYKCIDDLLQLPLVQQALSRHFHEKNESLRLTDMCSTVNDVLSQIKDQAQELQAALRKRGSEAAKIEKIQSYLSSSKTAKKNISGCLKELEKMDAKCLPTSEDKHFNFAIKVLKEARVITIIFFRFLESFACSTSLKPTTKRWSLVSKLMHNRQVACEDTERVKHMQKALEALEKSTEDLNTGS